MSHPQERRTAITLRAAVDRLLEEGLIRFEVSEGRRRAVPTERVVDPADRSRVEVVIQAMADRADA